MEGCLGELERPSGSVLLSQHDSPDPTLVPCPRARKDEGRRGDELGGGLCQLIVFPTHNV